jgi:hypothetical protein
MAYSPYKLAYPDIARTRQQVVDETRVNLVALRHAIISGGLVQGWAYRPVNGTAEQPLLLYFFVSGQSRVVRINLTWGTTGGEAGNVTKAAFYYADNESSGTFPTTTNGTYDPMADENGLYVVTISYDSSGNVTQTVWGSTP